MKTKTSAAWTATTLASFVVFSTQTAAAANHTISFGGFAAQGAAGGAWSEQWGGIEHLNSGTDAIEYPLPLVWDELAPTNEGTLQLTGIPNESSGAPSNAGPTVELTLYGQNGAASGSQICALLYGIIGVNGSTGTFIGGSQNCSTLSSQDILTINEQLNFDTQSPASYTNAFLFVTATGVGTAVHYIIYDTQFI